MDDARESWQVLGAGPAFGEVLRTIRELKGLSRKDLEGSSGRSYSQLRGLELGDRWPSDKMLTSIGPALGLAPSTLVQERDTFLAAVEGEHAEAAVSAWLFTLAPVLGDRFTSSVEVSAEPSTSQKADLVWQLDGRTVAAFEVNARPDGGVVLVAATIGSMPGMTNAIELAATAMKMLMESTWLGRPDAMAAAFGNGGTAHSDERTVPGAGIAGQVEPSQPGRHRASRRLTELLGAADDRQLLLVEGYLEGLLASSSNTNVEHGGDSHPNS